MNRRDFLQLSALSLAGAAVLTDPLRALPDADARKPGKSRRPNFLLISTDQQSAGALGCAGNPYLRTPAMDRLAAQGVMFERAYCANPICVPSRASCLTGLMPHENGVRYNADTFSPPMRGECFVRHLRDAGYDTGFIGKWHVPHAITDTGWSGFNHLAVIRDNGGDADIPEAADGFLRADHGDRPFLLFASFVNPHDICEWARSASGIGDRLPNGPIPSAPPPDGCPPLAPNHAVPAREPSVIREHQSGPANARTYPVRNWGGPEDGRWRQYLWAYYRMLEAVDAHIGRVLGSLRAAGHEEDTVVLFFSDHGDGMGAHRWNQKTLFYEEIVRVPLIVSWPGRTVPAGRECGRLVNLGTDLSATVLDFAGIAQPSGLRGASVKSFALGTRDGPAPEYVVSETNLYRAYGVEGEHHGRMVRSARYKYICFNGGTNPEQLFDLELDPGEMTTLADDPEHADVLHRHRVMLRHYRAATGDFFPGRPEQVRE